jgi:hypothetical protein
MDGTLHLISFYQTFVRPQLECLGMYLSYKPQIDHGTDIFKRGMVNIFESHTFNFDILTEGVL